MTNFKCINCGSIHENKKDNLRTCPLCQKEYLCELNEIELEITKAEDSNTALWELILHEREERKHYSRAVMIERL